MFPSPSRGQASRALQLRWRHDTDRNGQGILDALDEVPPPCRKVEPVAGDWLYIPYRWWHLVKCVQESLSISVGVMSPSELQRARRLPAGWTGERQEHFFRGPDEIESGR